MVNTKSDFHTKIGIFEIFIFSETLKSRLFNFINVTKTKFVQNYYPSTNLFRTIYQEASLEKFFW